ncbi:hypothetical protein D3C81_2313860 [compost metagenome]
MPAGEDAVQNGLTLMDNGIRLLEQNGPVSWLIFLGHGEGAQRSKESHYILQCIHHGRIGPFQSGLDAV